MSKDTRLPSEFDVTEFVRVGERNQVAAVVVKWSDATFVEDQDQWWMGGIYREVFLYSTGAVFLEDVFCLAGLDSSYRNGTLDLSTKVGLLDPDSVKNPDKTKIRFWSDRWFEGSVSHVTAHDLFASKNAREVAFRPEIIVNLDYMNRGLGSGSCGPDTLPQYRIQPGKHTFNFALESG